jgi:hypothetical protein
LMGKTAFNQWCLNVCKSRKHLPLPHTTHQYYSKMYQSYNVGAETIRSLEINVGRKFLWPQGGQTFLSIIQKHEPEKTVVSKLDFTDS